MRPVRRLARPARLALDLVTMILLVACGTTGSTPTSAVPTATLARIGATAQATTIATPSALPPGTVALDLPPGNAFLAPNGERIAWTNGEEICIYTTAGRRERCATPPGGIGLDTPRWSPDSRRLVFTEDYYRFLADPDLWVLDATDGALANLTDDGVSKGGLPSDLTDLGATVDVVPRWTADGSGLVFIRHLVEPRAARATVWTIGFDGQPPVQLGTLDSIGLETTAIALSPDGRTLAFNRGLNRDDDDRGVWIAGLDGRNARLLIRFPEQRAAAHFEFSPDGRFLLASPAASWITEPAMVGEVQIAALDGSAAPTVPAGTRWAAWSPTGAAIAYVVQGTSGAPDQSGLYVAAQPDQPGRRIQPGEFLLASPDTPDRLPIWSSTDTILLMLPDRRYVLVRLT